jgi:flagellar basal body rod protein FlgG
MNDLYSIAAVGLVDGQSRLEALSRNAASAAVPGFKRLLPAATLQPQQETAQPTRASVPMHRVDLGAGPFIATQRGLDVAIDAAGQFFGLSDGNRVWLTRSGSFSVDDEGYLVGVHGMRVQGPAGDIHLEASNVDIQPDGQILHDGVVTATLQLYAPSDASRLGSADGVLFRDPGDPMPVAPGDVRVRAAALEGANASSGQEMVDLLTVSRQFEALIRVMQGYDDLLGKTIQKLGEI